LVDPALKGLKGGPKVRVRPSGEESAGAGYPGYRRIVRFFSVSTPGNREEAEEGKRRSRAFPGTTITSLEFEDY
jgi:hypothetical protein